jgi:hypothetical protein
MRSVKSPGIGSHCTFLLARNLKIATASYFRDRERRLELRFVFRTAVRAERVAARAAPVTRPFALRVELRAERAGFDLLAWRAAVLVLPTSLVAPRFTSFVTELVLLAIALCAASALAAIAPRVEPIDSATVTSRSWSFDLLECVVTLGSFIRRFVKRTAVLFENR